MTSLKHSKLTLIPLILMINVLFQWIEYQEKDNSILAQAIKETPTFPLQKSIPDGTNVRVETTDSMKAIAEALKGSFEQQYRGSRVDLKPENTELALKNLSEEKTDLVAIGRPLTQEEKNQGLVEVPITRHKIAMIVAKDNPFDGSLTIEQFAQIFRGTIQDWSQVGGTASPIRFIDRPDTSDTRAAFRNYPVFQQAPFQAGTNAETISQDNTEDIIARLGNDGISYAIYDQVRANPQVKILKMHQTLPNDSLYPFSQPLYFVYKGPEANPKVQALLGYATAPENQQIIEEARIAELIPTIGQDSPQTALVPQSTIPSREISPSRFPDWLGWLLLPLLGGLVWWWGKNRKVVSDSGLVTSNAASGTTLAPVVPTSIPNKFLNRIILVPRNCREAYVYWEVSEQQKASLRQIGGKRLLLRIYQVTNINLDEQPAHSVQEYDCQENDCDRHVPIPIDNQDYIAELGYLTDNSRWLSLIRSLHVRVPACQPEPTFLEEEKSRIILVPRSPEKAYVYWEVPQREKTALRLQGGEQLKLLLHDMTDTNFDGQPDSTWEFDCNEPDEDKHVNIYKQNCTYVAELGYRIQDGRWLSLVKSNPVYISSDLSDIKK